MRSLELTKSLSLGTEVRNRASIIFDINDAIVTNDVSNVIDIPPVGVLGMQGDNRNYLPFISK